MPRLSPNMIHYFNICLLTGCPNERINYTSHEAVTLRPWASRGHLTPWYINSNHWGNSRQLPFQRVRATVKEVISIQGLKYGRISINHSNHIIAQKHLKYTWALWFWLLLNLENNVQARKESFLFKWHFPAQLIHEELEFREGISLCSYCLPEVLWTFYNHM